MNGEELDTKSKFRSVDSLKDSYHQQLDYLFNSLFSLTSKKTSKLVTGGFPSQRASYVENVSISWHHHDPDNKDPRIDVN